ncbi:MAG: hypothetical protein U1F25_20880, partial [Rubrivivax sp.]
MTRRVIFDLDAVPVDFRPGGATRRLAGEGLGLSAMAMQKFALFDTAIGRCGIAWNERGISGVQLPASNAAVTRARR